MNSIDFLSGELRRGHADHPWHGPSVAALLHDVTPEEAAARPIAGAHTIWELVLHLTAWNGEAQRRLQGATPAEPAEGDFPPVGARGQDEWREARERLAASVSDLREALAAADEETLDRRGGSLQDLAAGTGGTLRGMVNGVVQHLAYHGGQIALLRKALRPS